MKKEALKVGDRVAVYGTNFVGTSHHDRKVGVVSYVDDYRVDVQMPSMAGKNSSYHPKQCRRLRPKKKPLRVECRVRWVIGIDGTIHPTKTNMNDQLPLDDLFGKVGILTFEEDSK